MLQFTLEDGTTLTISNTASVMTNVVGNLVASAVQVGHYIKCGQGMFCRVVAIASV